MTFVTVSSLIVTAIVGIWGIYQTRVSHGLAKDLTEHQTRFSRLHQDQADVAAKLYGLLAKMQRNLMANQSIITGLLDPSRQISEEQKRKGIDEVWESYQALQFYFDEKNLYLPEDLSKKIGVFLQKCDQILVDQALFPIPQDRDDVDTESILRLNRAFDAVTVDIPKLKEEIRQGFRNLLGFYSS